MGLEERKEAGIGWEEEGGGNKMGRGRGRGQVSGTVQERQEIIRVHVVQLKTKKNQSINNRLQINQ